MQPTSDRELYREKYPVLTNAVIKYRFDEPDGYERFVLAYRSAGTPSLEFDGVLDELAAMVHDPAECQRYIGIVLGADASADEARDMIIETHSDLTQGADDQAPEAIPAAEDDETEAEPETMDFGTLFREWFLDTRYVGLPGKLSTVPVWQWWLASMVLTVFGVGVTVLIPVAFIGGIANIFILVGLIGFLLTSLTFVIARNGIIKGVDQVEDEEADPDKPKSRGGWVRRLFR